MLLDELESVLDDDVRLISVAPRFGERGKVTLALSFQSKSAEGMINTINRMNADPQFRNPFPNNQTEEESGFSFALTVEYVPAPVSAGVRLSEAPR